MTANARRWLLILALLGTGASGASTYVHYQLIRQPTYSSFCDVSSTVNCTAAYLSRFGSVRGVPVALIGLLWFLVVLALLEAARRGSHTLRENVSAYLFALSTPALAVVLYLAYAAFFVIDTLCLLCVATYVAVVGIFLVSGATTTIAMTGVPARAWGDLRSLLARPAALLVTLLFVSGMASAVAFFPRESPAGPDAGQAPSITADQRSEFERWYTGLPRVDLPVPGAGEKVLIVKFNDYQCPPCRQTYELYKGILAKYHATHPGAVRLVTKDFPLEPECNVNAPGGSHLAACEAAVAVRLAKKRGEGERLEAWLFANQPSLSPASVRAAARDIAGVQDFDAQYESTLEEVRADVAIGGLLEVRSTPTFFINGRRIPSGGLPPQYFEAALDYELNQAGR